MSDSRYGFYLRPSYPMCRALAEVHDLLARQYGLRVAGKFMPHATIKGFFRTNAASAELIDRLDRALAGQTAFPVWNHGAVPYQRHAIVLDFQGDAKRELNQPLQALHEAALLTLLPIVHPDCEFTPGEALRERFPPHLTLAMSDIPPHIFGEILQFVRDAGPIGPLFFVADTVQLVRFQSDDWSGPWWKSLQWEILHGWRLP